MDSNSWAIFSSPPAISVVPLSGMMVQAVCISGVLPADKYGEHQNGEMVGVAFLGESTWQGGGPSVESRNAHSQTPG